MSKHLPGGAIHVRDITLWAHVGVFEFERSLGQEFNLDFSIWLDLDKAAAFDDLSATADYSIAIKELQKLSFQINCKTIEHFSDQIMHCLEDLYGRAPMKVNLRKAKAPVPGFTGVVEVQRTRYWPN